MSFQRKIVRYRWLAPFCAPSIESAPSVPLRSPPTLSGHQARARMPCEGESSPSEELRVSWRAVRGLSEHWHRIAAASPSRTARRREKARTGRRERFLTAQPRGYRKTTSKSGGGFWRGFRGVRDYKPASERLLRDIQAYFIF